MGFLRAAKRADRDWDAICRRSGLCCYERDLVAGGVRIRLDRPCPHLNRATRACTVYERRFSTHATCSKVNLLHALFGRRMPLTCGYVAAYRPWIRGKRA